MLCPEALKAVSVEMAAGRLNRTGPIFNEKERNRKPDPEPTRYNPAEPIELNSGTYRLIYRLKK